ncbi:synaptic vesicle glycoprotein 2C isoform X2 [Anabrus simplex]|uniref:synaptic vesicle glycoprotein 2C isoform X2 n=1 Tax=Anabrus simplex TaxID=316456 RepID=UPI0034DD0D15
MKKYNVESEAKKAIDDELAIQEPVDFERAIALTGYGKFNYLLMLVALPSAMVSVFDTTTMAYILPAAHCDLELTNFDKGTLNAITYAGMISSAFMWGFLSDTMGRQKLLVVGFLLDGLCSFASSMAQTLWLMLLLRYMVGFLISGPYAVLMSYLAEFHGAQYRSRVIMSTGISVSVANILLPVIAWMLLPQPWSWDLFGGYIKYSSWNMFVALCAIPSLASGLLLLLFDESPKFLMSRGRCDDAMKVFKRIYSMNTGKHPDTFPVKILVNELTANPELRSSARNTNKGICSGLIAGWDQIKPLFLFPQLPKAVLVFSIQVGCLFGMNTIRLWVPQLFATMEAYLNKVGRDDTGNVSLCQMLSNELQNTTFNYTEVANTTECTVFLTEDRIYLNSIIVGATSALCYSSAGYLVNVLGKRYLMILAYFIAGICGISLYWSRSPDFVLALIALYLGFCGISSTAILGVVVDIFPTTLRSYGGGGIGKA